MPQLINPFDATQVDPTQGGASLPLGRHPVVIRTSSIDENSAGTGGFLSLNLEIIDGPMKGAGGVYRLNLYNASPKAVEIAHKQFSALCHVTGVFRVQASEQLHGIPFVIEVGPQKLTVEQIALQQAGQPVTPYTEVKKVFDMAGNEPGKAPAPQQAQPQGFGGQQPQAGQPSAWGANGAQPPAQAPAGAPAWGHGGAPAQAPQQAPAPAGNPAWGGGQPAQQQPQQQPAQQWGAPAQQPQQQPQPAAGWQQGHAAPAGAGGAAPWGAR